MVGGFWLRAQGVLVFLVFIATPYDYYYYYPHCYTLSLLLGSVLVYKDRWLAFIV